MWPETVEKNFKGRDLKSAALFSTSSARPLERTTEERASSDYAKKVVGPKGQACVQLFEWIGLRRTGT